MQKITKLFLIIMVAIVASCAPSLEKKEAAKTTKARSAQDRINAGQSGADSITKELDN